MPWKRPTQTLFLMFVILATASSHADENGLTPSEKDAGWRVLFDGRTLEGWTPQGGAKWRVVNGAIVADSGTDGWLRSRDEYADFQLRCEFRNIPNGNSGIFLRCPIKGEPYPAPEFGYELQINNEEPKYATASIEDYVQRLKEVNPVPNACTSSILEPRERISSYTSTTIKYSTAQTRPTNAVTSACNSTRTVRSSSATLRSGQSQSRLRSSHRWGIIMRVERCEGHRQPGTQHFAERSVWPRPVQVTEAIASVWADQIA